MTAGNSTTETELHDAQWFLALSPCQNYRQQGTIALKLINTTLGLCKAEQNK